MASMESIREQIKVITRNRSKSNTDILALMNRGLTQIAAGMTFQFPDGQQALSPPLPDLATQTSATGSTTSAPYADLVTDPINAFVQLPPDFQRNLYYLYSVTQGIRILNLFPTYVEFQSYYPMLNLTCHVIGAARQGNKLWYQGVPPATEVLRPSYYRTPTPTTEATIELPPDGLPSHLAEELLIAWCGWKIWTEIESGVGAQKVNTKEYATLLNKALIDLDAFCPVQRESVVMAPDWDQSYWD
jgi:hypothetical protein